MLDIRMVRAEPVVLGPDMARVTLILCSSEGNGISLQRKRPKQCLKQQHNSSIIVVPKHFWKA